MDKMSPFLMSIELRTLIVVTAFSSSPMLHEQFGRQDCVKLWFVTRRLIDLKLQQETLWLFQMAHNKNAYTYSVFETSSFL
jgi:hypothetical protein